MSSTHTQFTRGARIRIVFHDGSQLVARFVEKLSDRRLKTDQGTVQIADIRSADYYKPLPWEQSD